MFPASSPSQDGTSASDDPVMSGKQILDALLRNRPERRLGARRSRASRTVGNPDHSYPDSGEVVFLYIVGARHELPLLPPTGSFWIAAARWRASPSCLPQGTVAPGGGADRGSRRMGWTGAPAGIIKQAGAPADGRPAGKAAVKARPVRSRVAEVQVGVRLPSASRLPVVTLRDTGVRENASPSRRYPGKPQSADMPSEPHSNGRSVAPGCANTHRRTSCAATTVGANILRRAIVGAKAVVGGSDNGRLSLLRSAGMRHQGLCPPQARQQPPNDCSSSA